jgi:hypothetical protein
LPISGFYRGPRDQRRDQRRDQLPARIYTPPRFLRIHFFSESTYEFVGLSEVTLFLVVHPETNNLIFGRHLDFFIICNQLLYGTWQTEIHLLKNNYFLGNLLCYYGNQKLGMCYYGTQKLGSANVGIRIFRENGLINFLGCICKWCDSWV